MRLLKFPPGCLKLTVSFTFLLFIITRSLGFFACEGTWDLKTHTDLKSKLLTGLNRASEPSEPIIADNPFFLEKYVVISPPDGEQWISIFGLPDAVSVTMIKTAVKDDNPTIEILIRNETTPPNSGFAIEVSYTVEANGSFNCNVGPDGTCTDALHKSIQGNIDDKLSFTLYVNGVDFDQFIRSVPAPDFDGDGDIDLQDFGFFQNCFTGPTAPIKEGCERADLDHNGHVDSHDYDLFKLCMDYSKALGHIDPTCVTRFLTGINSDFDGDGDVDLRDFLHFQACFTGPNPKNPLEEKCTNADLDGDDDIDLLDFATFQACFSGPNKQAVPGCTRSVFKRHRKK